MLSNHDRPNLNSLYDLKNGDFYQGKFQLYFQDKSQVATNTVMEFIGTVMETSMKVTGQMISKMVNYLITFRARNLQVC
jgi:hypothetical protein